MRFLLCREVHQGWGWSWRGGGGRDYGPAACEAQSLGGGHQSRSGPGKSSHWGCGQPRPAGSVWPHPEPLSPTSFLIGSEECLVWVRKEGACMWGIWTQLETLSMSFHRKRLCELGEYP